jgi:hypothetical protein
MDERIIEIEVQSFVDFLDKLEDTLNRGRKMLQSLEAPPKDESGSEGQQGDGLKSHTDLTDRESVRRRLRREIQENRDETPAVEQNNSGVPAETPVRRRIRR